MSLGRRCFPGVHMVTLLHIRLLRLHRKSLQGPQLTPPPSCAVSAVQGGCLPWRGCVVSSGVTQSGVKVSLADYNAVGYNCRERSNSATREPVTSWGCNWQMGEGTHIQVRSAVGKIQLPVAVGLRSPLHPRAVCGRMGGRIHIQVRSVVGKIQLIVVVGLRSPFPC